jgi:predicted oxidoreductase (fatty acid repression mutant protein)
MDSKTFTTAVQERRTFYSIDKNIKTTEAKIQEVVEFAIKHAPSSFNSQTSRAVILFKEQSDKFWQLTSDILKGIVPAENFAPTEAKMKGFGAGYGTVLFFEDEAAVKKLQDSFPLYAAAFPGFSEHTSGMVQFIVWTALEAEGLGCSLQHYSPLVDETIQKEWGVPSTWKLKSQMPFGNPTAQPGEKTFQPIEDRVKVFH